MELSTRPTKSIGTDEDWAAAEGALVNALNRRYLSYEVNKGEGAFYGPKIDIKLKDALKREWQCATIQCDFALPERFDLSYIDDVGQKARPIMIHRVILGSLERFTGALIEHFSGAMPLWLAPVQCVIIPVSEKVVDYGLAVMQALRDSGSRVNIDDRNERLQKKIRDAEMEKIPYMVIVGEKEEQARAISVRSHSQGDAGRMELKDFILMMTREVQEKVK